MPAAGSGRRFGTVDNKLFAELGGQPVWYRTAKRLRSRSEVGRIVMAVSQVDMPRFQGEFLQMLDAQDIEVVIGGAERTDSVRAGLDALDGDDSVRFVAVHDAARPLVSPSDLAAVFATASQTGAAILASPVPGTLKYATDHSNSSKTVDRRDMWLALTPQVFRIELLRTAYDRYRGRPATDDAELVERIGYPVALVRGSAENIKITHPEDLQIAEAIDARQSNDA
jgi:2-C-methyl-D-erythritol 4-phosphate cytidylyltransferase